MPSPISVSLGFLVGAALLVQAGCGSQSPSGSNARQAPASPTSPVAGGTAHDDSDSLQGFLFAYTERSGDTPTFRLCESLCESFPPQCCGTSHELRGLNHADLTSLYSDRAALQDTPPWVQWTDDTVSCEGAITDGVMQVQSINGAALNSAPSGAAQAPAATRAPGEQCSSDGDCPDGHSCQIVPDCDTCDGGPMLCIAN